MMTAICQWNQIFVVNAMKTGLTAKTATKFKRSISMNHFQRNTMLANFLLLFGLREHERPSETFCIPNICILSILKWQRRDETMTKGRYKDVNCQVS